MMLVVLSTLTIVNGKQKGCNGANVQLSRRAASVAGVGLLAFARQSVGF